jgi:hypothetical protein
VTLLYPQARLSSHILLPASEIESKRIPPNLLGGESSGGYHDGRGGRDGRVVVGILGWVDIRILLSYLKRICIS